MSKANPRLAVPVLPAPSVCATVTVLAPSPELNVTAALKTPLVHTAFTGAVIAPVTFTVRPSTQVPTKVIGPRQALPAAGPVIASVGADVSSVNSRETVAVLPAASVCVTDTVLRPSGEAKVISVEYAPAAQATSAGVVMVPAMFTINPVSHAPLSVRVELVGAPAAGEAIVTTGTTVSRKKLRESLPLLPIASDCAAITFFIPSGELSAIAALNAPPVQGALTATFKSPLIFTLRPLTQLPVKVISPRLCEFAAGPVMVMAGGILLRTKSRFVDPVFPAASVCATCTFLVPSFVLKVIGAVNCALTQLTDSQP